jgi:hypothetical protein
VRVVPVRDARPDDWPRVKDLLAELGRPDVRDDPDEPRHPASSKSSSASG